MALLLHIVTKANDTLAEQTIKRQQESSENKVEVADISKGQANYQQLVDKIFAADSIQVW